MIEVREVLRGWLDGAGLRTVAERAGVDRKTARRYVNAAQAAGLERTAGLDAVDDGLVGAVVAAVRPVRPNGHGSAWEALLTHEEQIRAWVAGGGKDATPLSLVKIEELLARQGCGSLPDPAPLRDGTVRVPGQGHHGACGRRRARG
ncbi:MAG: hypothetical protein V9G19_04585 [Tetrasphaera sp.]